MRSLLLLLALTGIVGCSSDSAPEPEASPETPGAFIAQEEAPGSVRLMRTIATLTAENGQVVLFLTLFEPRVPSFEQAEELAKQREIPVQQLLAPAIKSELQKLPLEVVWFRSLEEWEKELVQ